VATARFEIVKVLKGADVLAGQKVIDTVYFGDGKKGDVFLVMGVDPPKLMWSTPLQLSEKAQEYLPKLLTLPKEGPDRLAFFQDYLEASDEMLARDAYDEFANAPYADVQGLKDRMKRDELDSLDPGSRISPPAGSGFISRCSACAGRRKTCRCWSR
jgi:hypothetical protein